MKVLLKSLKELEREYGIEERDGYLIISDNVVVDGMIKLLGKIAEAHYEKEIDSYIIDDYTFSPNFIKGEVTNEETTYTIKRLSDGIEYNLTVVK